MADGLYVRIAGKVHGPFDGDKLKRLAAAGKISRDDELSRDQQKWTPAGNVKGLFPPGELMPAPPKQTPIQVITRPPIAPPPMVSQGIPQPVITPTRVAPPPAIRADATLKPCPFCAEPILPEAKKCKHCGEIIDVALRAAMAPQAAVAQQPAIHITNVNNVNSGPAKRWSRGLAFVLSLLIPGLGQLYKGQLINAVVWFLVVGVGYVALVIPGVVLHLCCAIGAASGDPYR